MAHGTGAPGRAFRTAVPIDKPPRGRSAFALLALLALSLIPIPAAPPADAAVRTTKTALPRKRVTGAKPRPKPKPAYHPHPGLAPADEYFGRLGMSVLGVRSKVKDLGLDADAHPERTQAILNSAVWVEDAMRDWAKKYPFDRWLPRYAYALEIEYERMPGPEAHKRALRQIAYITAYFPQTAYARVDRAKLAQGVPTPDPSSPPVTMTDLQRLALLDGRTPPTMPPAPTPRPTPVPSAEPSASPEPQPAGSPAPPRAR